MDMDDKGAPISPEQQEDIDFIEAVHKRYTDCLNHTGDWRDEAAQAFDFVACHQWSDDEVAEAEEKLKPLVTFNRTEVFVQAVTGLEALNRQEVRYLARKVGKVGQGQADMWSNAAKYVNDDADAEVHHSHAFRDLVVCGMGWTETKMDYNNNPDGDIKVERRDPLRMFWDPRATQRNASDKRWVASIAPMSEEEIRDEWPEKADELTFSNNFKPKDADPLGVHNANEAWKYENDQSKNKAKEDDEWQVVQYQWFETKKFYKVQNPEDGSVNEFPAADWKAYKEKFPEATKAMRAVGPFPKRQYRRAFITGWTLLEVQDIECEDFTLQCMTGKHDRNNGVWYGLLRNLIDPQQWVNKLYSQVLHIINSNAKGGLMAERSAFANIQDAEDDWADPTKITWMNDGALQKGKVQQKNAIAYPQGLDKLLQYAMSMFTEVVGMNLELLGMADRVQPGVLEAQRKQAGMTILAWCFDAMRAYRKTHGRVLASYIREYISDGRLIRILGKEGEEYVKLMRDELAAEYDIVVAESPQSTNEKDRVFAVLQTIIPQMIEMGVMPPVETLDYLPLPAGLIEAWKGQLQDPQNDQKQKLIEEMGMALKKAEIAKTAAEGKLKEEQAKSEPIKAQATMIKATG